MLTPVRLDALLAVCEDRAAVRDSLKEVDTENLREFVTVAASLMAERRPDVLSLMIRALAQGCVTGNCDAALQSAAAIAIEGLGARRRVETNEHVTLHMD